MDPVPMALIAAEVNGKVSPYACFRFRFFFAFRFEKFHILENTEFFFSIHVDITHRLDRDGRLSSGGGFRQ